MPHTLLLLAALAFLNTLYAFRLCGSAGGGGSYGYRTLTMDKDMFAEADVGKKLREGALQGERYIATNRFKVRDGQGAKFEKRWADRKSRLANLPGFRYFSLLRRVDGGDPPSEADDKNYISMTVWADRPSFNEWRTGEAFKEAHGGGGTKWESLVGFTKLLTTALFILDGGPKVAFYDGLLPTVSTASLPSQDDLDGGWRRIEADGKNFIDPDSFVVQSRYTISPEQVIFTST